MRAAYQPLQPRQSLLKQLSDYKLVAWPLKDLQKALKKRLKPCLNIFYWFFEGPKTLRSLLRAKGDPPMTWTL